VNEHISPDIWQVIFGDSSGSAATEYPHPEYFAALVIWGGFLAVTLYGLRYGRVMGYSNMWDKKNNPYMYWSTIILYIVMLVLLFALVVDVILRP
jgi:hypothetical protein